MIRLFLVLVLPIECKILRLITSGTFSLDYTDRTASSHSKSFYSS